MVAELNLNASLQVLPGDLKPLSAMSLKDVETLRLILMGGSVIDWRKLAFEERSQVDNYLRLCLFDPSSPADEAWIRGILADAVNYLRETFRYRVAEAVANPASIHDLFLFASGKLEPRYQKISCIVLKVMHVIQHIEGRDLLHRSRVSEAGFCMMAEARVMEVLKQMMQSGFPIQEAEGNVKTRDSIVTKLLVKRETLAAQIYDRTRFRIVTRTAADILPVLHCLTERLFPFHLSVPGQTHNSLVDFQAVAESQPTWKPFIDKLHLHMGFEADLDREKRRQVELLHGRNEFSGDTYRVLNFVVDLPLRIDAHLSAETARETRARTVFVLVELQIVDEETAQRNDEGENSHERYKHRQRLKVLRRLSRGLVVPRQK
jgi:uncharacterized protein (TIGR04552 family)